MLPLRCHPAEAQWPPTYPGCSSWGWFWRRLRPDVAANLDLRKANAEALNGPAAPFFRSAEALNGPAAPFFRPVLSERAVWIAGPRSRHVEL